MRVRLQASLTRRSTTPPCRSTPTASTTRPNSPRCSTRCPMPTSSSARGSPAAATIRRVVRGAGPCASSPARCRAPADAAHRRHIGIPRGEPPGHLAIRGALPVGVPRRHRRVAGDGRPRRAARSCRYPSPCGRASRTRRARRRCAPRSISAAPCSCSVSPASAASRPWKHGRDGTHIVSIVVAATSLVSMFELLRRRQLKEKYAVLWLGVGIGMLTSASSRCCSTRWPKPSASRIRRTCCSSPPRVAAAGVRAPELGSEPPRGTRPARSPKSSRSTPPRRGR